MRFYKSSSCLAILIATLMLGVFVPLQGLAQETTIGGIRGLLDRDGTSIELANGKCHVLVFWASWAVSSRKQFYDMRDFPLLYPNCEFHAIGLESAEDLDRNYVAKKPELFGGFKTFFPVADTGGQGVAKSIGIYSIPTTFFVNGQGEIVDRWQGPVNGETILLAIQNNCNYQSEKAKELFDQLEAAKSFNDDQMTLDVLGQLADLGPNALSYGVERVGLIATVQDRERAWEYGISLVQRYGYNESVGRALYEHVIKHLENRQNISLAVSKYDSLAAWPGASHFVLNAYSALCQYDKEAAHNYGMSIVDGFGTDMKLMLELATMANGARSVGKDETLAIASAKAGCVAAENGNGPLLELLIAIAEENERWDEAIGFAELAVQANDCKASPEELQKKITYYNYKKRQRH